MKTAQNEELEAVGADSLESLKTYYLCSSTKFYLVNQLILSWQMFRRSVYLLLRMQGYSVYM